MQEKQKYKQVQSVEAKMVPTLPHGCEGKRALDWSWCQLSAWRRSVWACHAVSACPGTLI